MREGSLHLPIKNYVTSRNSVCVCVCVCSTVLLITIGIQGHVPVTVVRTKHNTAAVEA